jgi:hypothetical protein
MGLAGNMKLKHFRLIAAGVVVAGCAGCFGITKLMPEPDPPAYDEDWPLPAEPVAVTSTPAVTSVETTAADDAFVTTALGLRGTTAPGGKIKDVESGAAYKINAYQDDGEASVNRLKIDLDRDDKWDFKWTFHDDGTVTVLFSPSDDEVYDVECTIPQGARECTAAETPAAPVSSAGSPSDQVALGYVGRDLGSGKLKDVTKGQAFKVNVYQDDGASSATRAKVDLDRDDKWDEKWTFDGSTVSKQVSPNDDESYTQTLTWNGSDWE